MLQAKKVADGLPKLSSFLATVNMKNGHTSGLWFDCALIRHLSLCKEFSFFGNQPFPMFFSLGHLGSQRIQTWVGLIGFVIGQQ